MKHELFLSYSHHDREDVQAVTRFLETVGLRVWFDTRRGPSQQVATPMAKPSTRQSRTA